MSCQAINATKQTQIYKSMYMNRNHYYYLFTFKYYIATGFFMYKYR